MKNFVTGSWLQENLYKGNVVIFDCRYKMGEARYGIEAYNAHHIQNADFIDIEKDLAGAAGEHGGRHPLPDMDTFVARMAQLGMDNDSTVVIYDDGDMAAASRLWFMLRYIGKSKVYILEGGFKEWVEQDYEVTANVPPKKRAGNLKKHLRKTLLCDVQCVRDHMKDPDSVIVDSRARERFLGLEELIDSKAGHIPGAVNYFWQDNLKDGKMAPIDTLIRRFRALRDYKTLIVHCGSGITAGVNLLAMDEVGLKPLLYLGGWSDWISYPENEISTEGK